MYKHFSLVLEAHAFAHKGQRKLKKDGFPLGKFDRAAQSKHKIRQRDWLANFIGNQSRCSFPPFASIRATQ